jgi:hypothetical protein
VACVQGSDPGQQRWSHDRRIEHAVRAIEARQSDESNACEERERVAMRQALNLLSVLETISM